MTKPHSPSHTHTQINYLCNVIQREGESAKWKIERESEEEEVFFRAKSTLFIQ